MSAFFNIESAFQTALNSVSGKPYIDFEGTKPYVPVIGTKYWRTNHLPGSSQTITADALVQNNGVYQVDLIYPADGKGLKDILTDMDKIADAFNTPISLTANNTKIQLIAVGRGKVQTEPNWLFSFVKINYICYSY